jgi:hypothetical protein
MFLISGNNHLVCLFICFSGSQLLMPCWQPVTNIKVEASWNWEQKQELLQMCEALAPFPIIIVLFCDCTV